MRPFRVPTRQSFKHVAVLPRFGDAFRGLVHAYREEPNLRFHLFAGSLVAVTGLAAGLESWETAYLGLTVLLVLLSETLNTSVERAVDLGGNGLRHPLAAQAKEVAAGAVLLTTIHAVFAAWLIFVDRRGTWETLHAVIDLTRRSPWVLLFPLVTGGLGLMAGKDSGRR